MEIKYNQGSVELFVAVRNTRIIRRVSKPPLLIKPSSGIMEDKKAPAVLGKFCGGAQGSLGISTTTTNFNAQ